MRFLAGSTVLVAATALTGCGRPAEPAAGAHKVTLWLMKGSASQDFITRFTGSFEKEHPGTDLDVRIQEWTGIGEKVNAVLAGKGKENADVVVVGNTQVARYTAGGGLSGLTLECLRDWGSTDWLSGLADPASIDGPSTASPGTPPIAW